MRSIALLALSLGLAAATGNSGTAYVVRHADGHERWVRSPRERFEPAQQVEMNGTRLQAR